MNKRSFWGCIVLAISILSILGITIYNVVISKEDFFKATVYQILSLLFVIIITFFLTQKKNDHRRKIDMLEKMVAGIQEDIFDKEVVCYETDEQRSVALLKQKSLANRIQYLKDAKIHNAIEDEIEYVAKEMVRLREFYGEHMEDVEYMKKSVVDMERYIVNINDKCFAIRLKLYED